MSGKLLTIGGKFGDYDVVRLLGAGGMGAVYLIHGQASGQDYAVKILDPEVEKSDEEFKRRFIFEAELAMAIRHPNLIGVYAVGRDPDTALGYIIMEYVPGGTVRDRLDKWGALPLEEAADVVYRVAQALVAVNEHHIVHRDIKPDNIMFAADGVTPKLADLGIARRSAGTTQNTTLTQSGYLIGSPAYMAPEQMLDSHRADIRADIHALGITFWEMLAGRRPYEGDDTMSIIARAMRGEAVPSVRDFRRDVPEGYAELIGRMCCPNVERRVQSPEELVSELERLRLHPRETRAAIEARRAARSQAAEAQYGGAGGRSVVIAAAAIITAMVLAIGAVAILVLGGNAGTAKERRAEAPAGRVAQIAPAAVSPAPALPAAIATPRPAAAETAQIQPAALVQSVPAAAEVEDTEASDLREPVRDEVEKYLKLRRRVQQGDLLAQDEITDAINEAREIDPDMRAYDLTGKSDLAWKPELSAEKTAVLRLGKVFLMSEALIRESPSAIEDYRREKRRLRRQRFSGAADLSMDDTIAILGRAIGRDMFAWAREFGIRVDAGNTRLSQIDGIGE